MFGGKYRFLDEIIKTYHPAFVTKTLQPEEMTQMRLSRTFKCPHIYLAHQLTKIRGRGPTGFHLLEVGTECKLSTKQGLLLW